jgi:hypothetical protein
MKITWSATVMTAVSCIILCHDNGPGYSDALKKTKRVPVVVSWQGRVKLGLLKEAPKPGYIADGKTWAKLWKAWRGTEEVPSVNFQEAIVLVGVNNNPNWINVLAEIDDNGALQLTYASTLMGFINPQEGAYEFALIRRDGIKTIAGKEIEKD